MSQSHNYSPLCQCYDCRKGPPKTNMVDEPSATEVEALQYYFSEDGVWCIMEFFETPDKTKAPLFRGKFPSHWLLDMATKMALVAKDSAPKIIK